MRVWFSVTGFLGILVSKDMKGKEAEHSGGRDAQRCSA